MTKIAGILSDTLHRPFDLPVGRWRYYQEWNNALFLHWKVPCEVLQKFVPKGLSIDTYLGTCYVSLVSFTMQKIRPRYLPAVKFISDFHEINLRTYIDNGGKKGVYFLNIEAEKQLSVFIAKYISGLPYEKSEIKRSDKKHTFENAENAFSLNAEFEVKEKLKVKSELDKWLTERYCLYLESNSKIFRYDIHHKEWDLKQVELLSLELGYRIGEHHFSKTPDLAHYSDGVKVLAWGKNSA